MFCPFLFFLSEKKGKKKKGDSTIRDSLLMTLTSIIKENGSKILFGAYAAINTNQKRFHTRETIRSLRISRLAEIPPPFHD